MKLIYIDESGTFNDQLSEAEAKTNKRKSLYFVLSAIIVDTNDWEKVFGRFKTLRHDLRHNYGIKQSEQIHAYELIGGKAVWKHQRYMHMTSDKRQRLLKYMLTNYSFWPEISIITVAVRKLTQYQTITPETARERAYENLFNRIDKTFFNEYSPETDKHPYIVVNDGQEDKAVIKYLRKMRAFNKVRQTDGTTLDIKVKGLVEDPLFKSSKNSYFLQCVDHIAYATLHLFDQRLNPSIGTDMLNSGIYDRRGIKVVHYETSKHLPGIVIVPKLAEADVLKLRQKSLGK
ncbi:MAG TPA: DUF3800 domain-containing protein [Candidatus Saccharimonadales bacterium]